MYLGVDFNRIPDQGVHFSAAGGSPPPKGVHFEVRGFKSNNKNILFELVDSIIFYTFGTDNAC